MKKNLLIAFALAASAVASQAGIIFTYTVSGNCDPWLALGTSDPSNGSSYAGEPNDTTPDQSPVKVTDFVAGTTISWTATGVVGHPGDTSGPDGNSGYLVTREWGSQNGIPDFTTSIPINALIGVFIEGSTAKIFVMGSSGTITIPTDATGFYMGVMDGYGWKNNIGSFTVTISAKPEEITAVPEPTTYVAGLLLLAPFGINMLRNKLRKN